MYIQALHGCMHAWVPDGHASCKRRALLGLHIILFVQVLFRNAHVSNVKQILDIYIHMHAH